MAAPLSVTEDDELLITGTTTGVYECLAHDMRTDQPVTEVKQGELFAIRTTEPLHRGDKLYLLQSV